MKYRLTTLLIISLITINKTLSMDNNFNEKNLQTQDDLNQKYPKLANENITPPSSPKRTIPICPPAPRKQIPPSITRPSTSKKLIF